MRMPIRWLTVSFVCVLLAGSTALATPAADSLLDLVLTLQASRAAIQGDLPAHGPRPPLAEDALWSISARLEEAFRLLRAGADTTARRQALLERIERLPAAGRATFRSLVQDLQADETFTRTHGEDRPADPPLTGAIAENPAAGRLEKGPRPPVARADLAGERRPVLDLRPAPPRIGTIEGALHLQPVQLTFDRRLWTISGAVNLYPVRLQIDHDARTITGGLNQTAMHLGFDWSPERIVQTGAVNGAPYQATIDWRRQTLDGTANRTPLHLEFNLDQGEIKGFVNHRPVALHYDKVSGVLEGAIDLQPVRLTLINLDLFDFITHFYLFVR
ncbi:MAG: hypothetical protein GX442_09995 [Candidatus Riflebacteria bacterium]|nr:hypothetical protein [Candidatus Riflebacteria bacterium]